MSFIPSNNLFYELPDVFLNNLQNWHSLYCLAQTRTNLLEELPSGLDEGLCIFCCNSIMICSLHTDNLRVLLKCLGRSVWLNGANVFAPLKIAIRVEIFLKGSLEFWPLRRKSAVVFSRWLSFQNSFMSHIIR